MSWLYIPALFEWIHPPFYHKAETLFFLPNIFKGGHSGHVKVVNHGFIVVVQDKSCLYRCIMSGLEVIGGISAVISILSASNAVYNSARDGKGLPELFQATGRRLPILVDTLQTCKNHLESIKDSMPADVCEALEKILDACDEKCRKLREIFEKVIPGEKETWEKRYLKVVRRLGKGNEVQKLMLSITQDVQLIVNNYAVKSAQPEQTVELENIVKEMKSVKSSLPEEESSAMAFNSSGGAQTNNVNSGSGQQINNNAPVSTQNFNSGKK